MEKLKFHLYTDMKNISFGLRFPEGPLIENAHNSQVDYSAAGQLK